MDCVYKDVMLPQLRVGDWMVFPHFGAYTLAGATNFNGIKAAEYGALPSLAANPLSNQPDSRIKAAEYGAPFSTEI
jgi:ornithine decarboxylase